MTKASSGKFYLRTAIIIIMTVSGILLSSSMTGNSINHFFYDLLFSINSSSPSINDRNVEDIIIVAIDEASFKHLNHQWPWPRSWHAELIEQLNMKGAKTIAFDVIFTDPGNDPDDAVFAQALKKYNNIILAGTQEKIESASYVSLMNVTPQKRLIQSHTRTGLDIMPLDTDGILRRAYLEFNGETCFGYEAANNFIPPEYRSKLAQLKQTNPEIYINFSGPPGSIKKVSYYQALTPSSFFPENYFKNKLVFVGFFIRNTADLTSARPDHYPTPYVRFGSGYMPGVEIQANIAATLINHVSSRGVYSKKQLIKKISTPSLWILSSFFWIITAIAGFCLSIWVSAILLPFILIAQWVISLSAFHYYSIYIPLVPVAFPSVLIYLSGPFLKYYEQLQDKQFIKKIFSRYLSPGVVKHLLKSPDKIRLGGEYADASVLFIDIEKFTWMANKTDAEKLIRILSRYLGTFSDIILKNDGMIDKIAGDSIMAVWGVPVSQKDHADTACRTAIEISRALKELQMQDEKEIFHPVNIRMGINSGKMLAGNIGGKHFSNYTVHGVDVNLAARLEAMNKLYKTRILIGENTVNLLSDAFLVRRIDYVRLKGWQSPFHVYELAGLKDTAGEQLLLFHQLFSRAMDLYFSKDYKEAKTLFEKSIDIKPDDVPCNIYINRCNRFIKTPPGNDWSTVYEKGGIGDYNF